MALAFRNPASIEGFGSDYIAIRDFLIRWDESNYPFGRWDWMVTHGYLDASYLGKIGIWEEDGAIVGLATYDCQPGGAFLRVARGYEPLRAQMLPYAERALSKDGAFKVMIADADRDFQAIAAQRGYQPTQDKESDAVYAIGDPEDIRYDLPDGFRVVSMADELNLLQYGKVLWKGFNHEANGEGSFDGSEANVQSYRAEMLRPNVDLSLKIAVAAPNGDFVSYCGMWWDPACPHALVEPVATDPAYRRMGLGRAAVLEGVRRCGLRGAKAAFVGSSQQFYYSIGFRPYATGTYWERKKG